MRDVQLKLHTPIITIIKWNVMNQHHVFQVMLSELTSLKWKRLHYCMKIKIFQLSILLWPWKSISGDKAIEKEPAEVVWHLSKPYFWKVIIDVESHLFAQLPHFWLLEVLGSMLMLYLKGSCYHNFGSLYQHTIKTFLTPCCLGNLFNIRLFY